MYDDYEDHDETKMLCVSRNGKNKLQILTDGQLVELVSQFKLGRLLSEDKYCENDMQSRHVARKGQLPSCPQQIYLRNFC